MSGEIRCPRCGGKMKDGELHVIAVSGQLDDNTRMSQQVANMYGNAFSSLGLPFQGGEINVEGPVWREESDKEEGLIIKRKGKRDLPVKGMRCLECGYIELFVRLE